jgi:stearoyl-CoA desaturase (delta-9 desaturase)
MNNRWQHGPHWPTCIYVALIHCGALAAFWNFSFQGFFCFLFLYFVTGCLGITLGFHRLLTHGSFETSEGIRHLLALFGTLAGEGGVIQWVADHRKHHQFADKEGDPHSPRDGFSWAHMIWTMPHRGPDYNKKHYEKYAPDLLDDPVMLTLDKTFIFWHVLMFIVLFAFGGWPNVLWGFCFRLVFVLHSTWLVNSAAHKWGYRSFDTADDSRNNGLVAALTFGEGWHNNHHHNPTSARHGLAEDEPDVTYQLIKLLERCGLVWGVKT